MIEEDIAFLVISILTIGGAIFALESKQIVYGAIALGLSFLGIAGLFVVLDATFVAMFQIIVYVGAVAVLIVFTVMLVGEGKSFKETRGIAPKVAGLITAVALALTLVVSFGVSKISNTTSPASIPNFLDIGKFLTNQFAPLLELLAVMLAASLLGALTLAKVDKEDLK
jgi:NADH-quinone oxidoreductase subunit J